MNQKFKMDREQIIEVYEATKEFNLLMPEEKEAFDFEDITGATVESVSANFTHSTIRWCFHIEKYEMEEDYEMCAKLRELINLDKLDCIRLFETYFGYVREDDEMDIGETLENIVTEARNNVKQNYDKWENLM